MTAITRWTANPDLYRNPFDRLFNQAFNDFLGPVATEEVSNRRFLPAVDIRETQDALTLIAELPGLKRENVHITLENSVLTISGERTFEKDAKEENYHRIERAYGTFSRSFTLPANVATEKVDASFTDGVLTITLPKSDEAKPRKISIK
jgi:HSP20 family protein